MVEGQLYHPATRRLRYGGQDLTQHLGSLLRRGEHGGTAADDSLSAAELERLKEACMRVAQSAEAAEQEVRVCFLLAAFSAGIFPNGPRACASS